MKNYYELMEIDKNADERQIKAAYFKLVRKYSPERSPEEFKKLRAAYETLSNHKKREAYDRTESLQGEEAYLFGQANKARQEGRIQDAIRIYEMLVKENPTLNNMRFELARTYEADGKTGRAIEVWEELCKLEPNNSVYSYELAESYSLRGWRKKAISRYERTVALDPGNSAAWADLIEAHEDAGEHEQEYQRTSDALSAFDGNRVGSVRLYVRAFDRYIASGDKASAEDCLHKIISTLKSNKQHSRKECSVAVIEILATLATAETLQNMDLLPHVRQIAELKLDIGEKAFELLDRAEIVTSIAVLVDASCPQLIVDILMVVTKNCDCQNCKNDIAAIEASIIHDLPGYRPYIVRLKKEHPHLYAKHSAFFNEALLSRTPEKLLYQRVKYLSKHGLEPTFINADGSETGEDEPDSDEPAAQSGTYRRDGAKVGRNDPCPCGSGKKYKKCCGA